ncbi:MAG TPA: hypothetical protein DEH15_21155 [Marinilabiliales bacterium]|nr:hypothetical protein [Marinilabiliales bacterium]
MYESHYFLRCSPFVFANNKPCYFENNFTTLEEEKCVYLKIDYFQRKYDPIHDSKIDVILDNNIISHSSGLRTKMETRYDSIKLGFQPKNTMHGTQSEIIICTSNSTNKKQTEISLPIKIVKRNSLRIVKAIVMSIGACLVGLPALLPDTFEITWKILIAVFGAGVMGLNNFFDSTEK